MRFIRAAVLALPCIFAHPAYAADAPDPHYIAELFIAAQKTRTQFPDILKINPSLDEALLYNVQRRFVAMQVEAGSPIGGFKASGYGRELGPDAVRDFMQIKSVWVGTAPCANPFPPGSG